MSLFRLLKFSNISGYFGERAGRNFPRVFWVLTTSILVEIVLSLKTENFLTDAMQKVIGGEGQIFDPIEKFQWF